VLLSSNSFSRTINFRTLTRLRRLKAVDVDAYQQPNFGEKEWNDKQLLQRAGGGK